MSILNQSPKSENCRFYYTEGSSIYVIYFYTLTQLQIILKMATEHENMQYLWWCKKKLPD